MDWIKEWAGPLAAIVSVGTLFFAWLTAGGKQAGKDLADHKRATDETLDDHGRRIQSMEDAIKHLPDKDSLHKIELTMKDLQVQFASLTAAAQATERTARRVEDFLINQAKGS